MQLLPKIAIAMLLPVAMGGAGALGLLSQQWRHGDEVLLQRATQALQFRAEVLGRQLAQQRATLRLLSAAPSLAQPDLATVRADLRAWSAGAHDFEGLYLLTLDGRAMPGDGPSVFVGDRPYFAAVKQGQEVTADPAISRVTGRAVLVHVVPVRHADGQLRGGLCGAVPLADLFELVSPASGDRMATGQPRLLLLDSHGQRLAGSLDAPLPLLQAATAASAPLTQAVLAAWQPQGGATQRVRADGRDWQVMRAPVPSVPWQLLQVQPEQALYAPVRHARQRAWLLLAFTLVLAALGGWLGHRLVTRRMARLTQAHQRLQDGDLSARVAVEGNDELSGLARSFNRMAQALASADQRFRVVFESFPHPVALSNLTDHRFIDVNPAFVARMGRPREQLLGRSMVDLGLVVDFDTMHQQRAELLARGSLDAAPAHTRLPDGTDRWALFSSRIVTLDGQPVVLTVTTDVTAIKLAEARLRDSQRLLASTFDLLPEALSLFDADTGRFVDVNRMWERRTGLRRDQALGRLPSELGIRMDDAAVELARQQLRSQGFVDATLVTFTMSDGRQSHSEVSASALELEGRRIELWLTRDVTARRAAEQAIARSEERFRHLFNLAPVALVFVDSAGRLLSVNQQWVQLVGHDLDDMATLDDWWLLAYPDATQRQQARQRFTDEVMGRYGPDGGPLDRAEFQVHCKDGRYRIIQFGGARIGEGLIISAHDMTERRRIDAELHDLNATLERRVQHRTQELQAALEGLQRAQDELVRSEKLASLGALVAGLAHELNTPIGNAVMVASTLAGRQSAFEQGMAQGLRRSALTSFLAGLSEVSQVLERNLQRAAELVGGFKQLAVDQTSYQRRRFALHEVVHEVALALSPTLRRAGVQLLDQTPTGLQMDSHPGPLGQVLVNLVNNAVLHGYAGGATGAVRVQAAPAEAGWLQLQVSDDGGGIAADNLRHIFDPFFTTRLGQGGSGLGLHIVYTLVTGLLGGQIDVHSVVGQGTTFTLRLPCVAPSPAQLEPASTEDIAA